MNIQDKPDYKVFASNARGGEVTDFPNLERGWGETIDKTGKIPPMEWFNLVGKRADEWLLYLTQRGVAEWDFRVKYPQYAMCQLGGIFYIATAENENNNPANSQAVWMDLAKYLGVDGKLDANKVVQTTGQSTTNVMSQKAVTDALGKKLNIADLPFISKNKADNDEWVCGDTGLTVKWGSSSSSPVTFKKPFKKICLFVLLSPNQNRDIAMYDSELHVSSKSVNGFTISRPEGYNRSYIAIGY